MSRYRGPRRRLIRKLDNLPGLTNKRIVHPKFQGRKKNSGEDVKTPGQHGKPIKVFVKRLSAYGLRLIEKQKVRFNYHLTENQLVRYVNQAKRSNKGTGDVLLNLLEMRLDNIIYRLGMAPTIVAARQLVTHGHVLVNQKKVNIPSYSCKTKDAISIRKASGPQRLVKNSLKAKDQASKKKTPVSKIAGSKKKRWQSKSGSKINQRPESSKIKWRPPRHLDLNRKNLTAIVKRSASAKTVPFEINELLVVEFYSQN